MPEELRWKCVNCEKEFGLDQWYGCRGNPGRKHAVLRKTYYCKWSNGLVKHLNTDETIYVKAGEGKTVNVGLLTARFQNGTFETDDPEYQWHLDQDRDLCSHDEFVEFRLPEKAKTERAKTQVVELRTLLERTQAEVNELKAANAAKEPELVEAGAPSGAGAGKAKARR